MGDERLMFIVENHIRSTDQNEKVFIAELEERIGKMEPRFKPRAIDVLKTLMSRQERGW